MITGAASEVHFAHRAHELLPHANLSRGTLAAASPFAAASAAAGSSAAECAGLAASGPAANLAGLPARRKKARLLLLLLLPGVASLSSSSDMSHPHRLLFPRR